MLQFTGGVSMGKIERVSVISALVLAGGAIALVTHVRFSNPMIHTNSDATWYVLSLCSDETIYAPKFTENAFRSLRVGMTTNEVLLRIGYPLLVHQSDMPPRASIWRYTRAPIDGNYWIRNVHFDDKGRIVSFTAEYYMD